MYLPLVGDDDDLQQSGHVEDADEEDACGDIHLGEEEDEGGGEGAEHGVQEVRDGHD